MSRPLIQIDNDGNAREMTDEEYANYEAIIADSPAISSAE